jgi:hypothetical protein
MYDDPGMGFQGGDVGIDGIRRGGSVYLDDNDPALELDRWRDSGPADQYRVPMSSSPDGDITLEDLGIKPGDPGWHGGPGRPSGRSPQYSRSYASADIEPIWDETILDDIVGRPYPPKVPPWR